MNSPQPEPMKQGLAYYNSSLSQTPTASNKFHLPPRGDAASTMSRSGTGSRQGFRVQPEFPLQNNLNEVHSSASIRAKSRDFGQDDAASMFNYMPRATPNKNTKSILYRMHNKPKKTLNIADNSSQRYRQNADV